MTPEHQEYIRKNYLKKTTVEIGRKLGLPTGTVTSFLKREKMKISPELAKQRRLEFLKSRAEQRAKKYHYGDSTIKAHYLTMPLKTLAAKTKPIKNYYNDRRMPRVYTR